ncbi:type IV toxin-antitoxin system YeeU family antitoxin [Aeromonas caviae]
MPFTTGISAQSGITTLSGKKCLDLWGQIHRVSLLWDRCGVYGDADEQWLTDIDTVIPSFIERLSKLFQQGELLSDQDKLVTLQQGEWVCLANPKASYGYLYLDVYRQECNSVQATKI